MPNRRNTRDLGLHGAGKGDAPRTAFNAAWRASYDAISWGVCRVCFGVSGCPACRWTGKDFQDFERSGHRLVKRYK